MQTPPRPPIRFGSHLARWILLVAILVPALATTAAAADPAPYVDSAAIRARFDTITADDMELLRTKKILLGSRSFGLNLAKGLGQLKKLDPTLDLTGSYKRYDVFKAGGDLSVVPADAFTQSLFVHVMVTHWPLTKRLEEINALLSDPAHGFGSQVDAVIVFYHTATPEIFDTYQQTVLDWQKSYPKARIIAVTSGFMGPKHAKNNEASFAFGEKARSELRGQIPLYDLGAILSDDFRAGHVYAPEYSADPAEVHPNLPAGETMMAKGFLLILKEAFAWSPSGSGAPSPTSPTSQTGPTSRTGQLAPTSPNTTLSPTSADYRAVRAILDANDLKAKAVEGVTVVENGRVVGLFLQEGGMVTLPDAIGGLTELRKLHLYGDRNLPLPRLRSISPALGKCKKLEELLLNQNDLTTLPAELANLNQLTILSVADNHLANLPPTVTAWAQKFDPRGLADQRPAPPQKP